MCDEYDDERMMAFWRRLEQLEPRERLSPEAEGTAEPLVKVEPDPVSMPKAKPRALTH